MNEYLKKIIDYKKGLVHGKIIFYSSLKEKFEKNEYSSYAIFKKQISVPNQINLIAEIKKASPSRGLIREEFDLLSIAETYSNNQAAAISVLTEDKYFLGRPAFVKKVTDKYHVPVLAKDFFIHEGQIYEARFNGASAILLIVAILDDHTLKTLMEVSQRLDVDCLVEVHTKEELHRALECGAEIIGVNNRDLNTFEVNIQACEEIIPHIPKGKVIVAESGISSNAEIKHLKSLGVNAVLIGETFMRTDDIGSKVRDMMAGVND